MFDHPKFIVSNRKEDSICTYRVISDFMHMQYVSNRKEEYIYTYRVISDFTHMRYVPYLIARICSTQS